jgi:hypothetical protein
MPESVVRYRAHSLGVYEPWCGGTIRAMWRHGSGISSTWFGGLVAEHGPLFDACWKRATIAVYELSAPWEGSRGDDERREG